MKSNKNSTYYDFNHLFASDKTPTLSPSTVGKRIRQLRQLKEMSIEEFALKLNKSYEYVVAYENDRRNPKEDTLDQMAEILGTSKSYLKDGFIRRSFSSEDNMYELEYRDKPLSDSKDKEFVDRINKNINIIKENKTYNTINHLQVLSDISDFLATDAMKNNPNIKDKLPEGFITFEEYIKQMNGKK